MTFNESLRVAFPASEASDVLRERVRARVHLRLNWKRRATRRRWIFAGAMLTTFFVALGIAFGPTAMALYHLAQINGSLSDVRTAVMEFFAVENDGSMRKTRSCVYAEGKWRLEQGREWQIYRDGKLWFYDPENNRVAVLKKSGGPGFYNPSGFTVKSMLSDHARWDWKESITFGSETVGGRELDKVTITNESGRERTIVLADPRTNLPVEFRNESRGVRGWQLSGVIKPQFDVPVSPDLFEVKIPPNVPVVDLDKEAEVWKTKLERPLLTLDFDGTEISIRDIAVTPRGHVFILYTNGETAAGRQKYANRMFEAADEQKRTKGRLNFKTQWHVMPSFSVTDSVGTVYEVSIESLQPYVGGRNPAQSRGLVLSDGQVLQGAWLLPRAEQMWKPKTLKFELTVFQAGREKIVKRLERHFERPNSGIVPDWMSQVIIGPQTARDILRVERRMQRGYAQERGDWRTVESILRADLEEIISQEREGHDFAKGTIYFELYGALSRTGKRTEALEFLRLAADEPMYPDQYPKPQIEAALRKEGIQ